MSPEYSNLTIVPKALLAVALLIAGWSVAGSVPAATADEGQEIVYLALGDSVPSGAELGEDGAYPRRLGERLVRETGRPVRYANRSRERAQSGGVLTSQLDGLAELRPDVATLTVGANDFLVPTWDCVATMIDNLPGEQCDLPDPWRAIPALESNLRQTVARLVAETEATVAVTTYYNPFPRGARCGSALVDVSMRALNTSIARVVREFADRAVLVDLIALFRGHEGQEPAGWFTRNPVGLACSDIHPNADGQQAIADAAWNALAPRLADR